jgi:nucleolin
MDPSQKQGDSGADNNSDANATFSLFVGNLSFDTVQESLRKLFQDCGPISDVRIVTDRNSGKSKGYGYVDFQTQAALDKALAKGDVNLDGRPLRLDHANAKPNRQQNSPGGSSRGGGGGGRGRGRSASPSPSPTLFIGNLSYDATEDNVRAALGGAGDIKSVRIIQNKGFGYVEFDEVESASRAIEQSNGVEIAGRQIRLDYSSEQTRGGGRGGNGNRGGRGRARGGNAGGPGSRGGRGRGNYSRGGGGGRGGNRFN